MFPFQPFLNQLPKIPTQKLFFFFPLKKTTARALLPFAENEATTWALLHLQVFSIPIFSLSSLTSKTQTQIYAQIQIPDPELSYGPTLRKGTVPTQYLYPKPWTKKKKMMIMCSMKKASQGFLKSQRFESLPRTVSHSRVVSEVQQGYCSWTRGIRWNAQKSCLRQSRFLFQHSDTRELISNLLCSL